MIMGTMALCSAMQLTFAAAAIDIGHGAADPTRPSDIGQPRGIYGGSAQISGVLGKKQLVAWINVDSAHALDINIQFRSSSIDAHCKAEAFMLDALTGKLSTKGAKSHEGRKKK